MIAYFIYIFFFFISYIEHFFWQTFEVSGFVVETKEKFGLSKTSKLNCLYGKKVKVRLKPVAIVFVIELIFVIIYTPILFTLYFLLDYKKIMELTSAILGLSLFLIEDITSMVITLYDERLCRRRKKYFNAIQKLCDIEEQRAKEETEKKENNNEKK